VPLSSLLAYCTGYDATGVGVGVVVGAGLALRLGSATDSKTVPEGESCDLKILGQKSS